MEVRPIDVRPTEASRPSRRRRYLAATLVLAAGASASSLRGEEGAPEALPPLVSAWDGTRLTVPLGLPVPWIPPSNPLTEAKVDLGRRLFFERALSRDRSKSCADCHPPGRAFADGRPTALGVRDQVGPRNVPSLLNVAIYPALFWDGRAVSLEAQAEGPLLAPTELDMTEELLVERIEADPVWAPRFQRAFGTPTITLRRVASALACFERTLLAADTPFDRWWFQHEETALDEAAQRGWVVFRTKGACASCHVVSAAEAPFSDFEFHATGTVREGSTDLGRFAVTGAEEDRGRFRTPTLRNVARTAPYFHDGSAATLAEVVAHYERGGRTVGGRAPEIAPLRLTDAERSDLLAFLDALTSPGLDAAPTASSPLADPEAAPDAGALRLLAEEALERDPDDLRAWTALLVSARRLEDADRLEDAIERARPHAAGADLPARGAFGAALLHLARRVTPPDSARLHEAAAVLAPHEGAEGDPRRALDLAYARHLLGEAAGARAAYERALDGPEPTRELALRGLASLVGGTEAALGALLEELAARRAEDAVLLRWRAEWLDRTSGRTEALALLEARHALVTTSPRAMLLLAAWWREAERHGEALALERAALERGGRDPAIHGAVERAWRAERPLASFDDVAALDHDARRLFSAVAGDPRASLVYRNDIALRLREVVARWAVRGDARTQWLAEGAPPQARAALARVVELYEEAVAFVPADAQDRPFTDRWTYASVLNDAALMRHYWLDVRDLDRAEELYLRAFELTDGAYQDTYFYNLQYLYGVERPGHEERWWRLARKASERILRETPEGGFAPDEGKREAARRDAEALRRRLDAAGR